MSKPTDAQRSRVGGTAAGTASRAPATARYPETTTTRPPTPSRRRAPLTRPDEKDLNEKDPDEKEGYVEDGARGADHPRPGNDIHGPPRES